MLVVLIAGGLLVAVGCGERGGNPVGAASQDPPPKATGPMRHRVETAAEKTVPINVVTAPGKIEANHSRISRVLPPVAGRITQVLVRFGDAVAEKQPVAILESAEADAAVSAVLQAEAAVNQAKANLLKAEADIERLRDLFENKAIARKELLQAENQEAQAKAGMAQSEALLLQALRRLDFLDLKRGEFGQRITVRAPIPGKVLEVNVAPGEFRNDPNSPLMTIADLSTVWITADVPESAIRFIQRGERIEAELTAFPGELFPGRVTQIGDLVDPQTRTIKVRGELDNRGGRLRPEMFGQIRHIDAVRPLPCVPLGAIVHVQGRTVVFVESAADGYEQRVITTGERMGEWIPVLSGLRAGEKVVVDGALLVRTK